MLLHALDTYNRPELRAVGQQHGVEDMRLHRAMFMQLCIPSSMPLPSNTELWSAGSIRDVAA